jgi:hypothetical protein
MCYKLLLLILFFLPKMVMGITTQGPSKAIVFQPQFKWANQTWTEQGTGSFIRGEKGAVIGLTSAHFIDFSGPRLIEVSWLDIRTKKGIATSVNCWGMPGKEGCYDPLDLRSDYILMLIEGTIDPGSLLSLDERSGPEVGERVWFPNKNPRAALGFDLIDGKVSKACDTHLEITLNQGIDLQTRSGTPILSQLTGKVIGILTGGGKINDKTLLYLAPGRSLYQALHEAQQQPLLHEVVGELPSRGSENIKQKL